VTPILFDHIAIAMPRMADAAEFLVGSLGGEPYHGSPSRVYRFAQWRFSGGGRLEVLEPLGPDGFLSRFLAQRGAGVHHVTFKVPSLAEVCERAEAHGYKSVGFDDSNPSWKEAFLHPKQALGIVVQFAETPAGSEPLQPSAVPPGPANPPPAVTVRGLRMSARSGGRARAQWEGVLGGECAEGAAGELVFTWPGSPMRIVVGVDPTREDGPESVELSSGRALSLPAGSHPVLGATFVVRAS